MRQGHPLRELLLARARQFFREPETIFWVYGLPVMLMAVLGLAFGHRDMPPLTVRVAAEAPGDLERIARTLDKAAGLQVERVPLARAEEGAARHATHLTVIDRHGRVEYLVDPARPRSRLARALADEALQEAAGRRDPVPATLRPLEKPGTRYIDWLVPGLIGLNLVGGGLYGVGFVAVDHRMRRLLKRFRATPMRRSHFLLSLIGGRLLFFLPELGAILLVARFAFGVELRGSLLALTAAALVGALTFAGLGLLLACRARKIETISGLLNVTLLPLWLFSGIFFSANRFPDWLQPAVQALPLTQLVHALRAIALEGEGLLEQWQPLALCGVWGVVAFPLALRLFRWQ